VRAVGVDNIKRQHSYLSEKKQKKQFFFVHSCQPIDVFCILRIGKAKVRRKENDNYSTLDKISLIENTF